MTKVNKIVKIGERIKAKRKVDRLSAEDLAAKLDLKATNIYKWERGSTPSDPEEYLKIEAWLNNSESGQNESNGHGSKKTEPGTLAEALEIIKQQNAFLQRMVESSLASLSTDVNNNAASIRAEIRGYAQRQILKEVNNDDDAFLKAKAEADKIYLLNLKQLLGSNTGNAST